MTKSNDEYLNGFVKELISKLDTQTSWDTNELRQRIFNLHGWYSFKKE